MSLILRKPWTRQPQTTATPRGSVFSWLPSVGPIDAIGGVALGSPNGGSIEVNAHGVAFRANGAAERYAFTTPQALKLQSFTSFWIGVPTSTNTLNSGYISLLTDATAAGSPYVHWALRRSTANSSLIGVSWNNGSFQSAESASGALTFDVLNCCAMTHGGGRVTAWSNGVKRIDTTVNVGTISYGGSAPTVNLGGAFGSNNSGSDTLGVVVFPRVMSDGEVEYYTANPWQLFAHRRTLVSVAAAAGGSSVGTATETDTALALAVVQSAAVGRADETDTAIARSALQITATGVALETDTALALDASSPSAVGVALESDAAFALSAVQASTVGMAVESSAAFALAAVQAITAGMALEIDASGALAAVQSSPVGRAAETDAALALTAGSGSGIGASAAEVWSYVLSNGLTAEETVVQTHSMLTALTAAMATCPADLTLALKLLRNKQITSQATGKMTVYDDDGSTVLVEGNLFEDAAGTTAYRGQGAERRERLA